MQSFASKRCLKVVFTPKRGYNASPSIDASKRCLKVVFTPKRGYNASPSIENMIALSEIRLCCPIIAIALCVATGVNKCLLLGNHSTAIVAKFYGDHRLLTWSGAK